MLIGGIIMQKNTSEKKKKSTISDVANYVGVSTTFFTITGT